MKAEVCGAGRVDVSRSGKAIRPCPHAALLQKLKEKEGKSKKSRGFSMSCGLVVLTRKNRGKLSIVESFLLPASARLSRHIKSETKFSKFSIVIGHTMKYSSAMSGRAERENIWLSVMAHGPRCAWSVRHEIEPTFFPSGPTKLSR